MMKEELTIRNIRSTFLYTFLRLEIMNGSLSFALRPALDMIENEELGSNEIGLFSLLSSSVSLFPGLESKGRLKTPKQIAGIIISIRSAINMPTKLFWFKIHTPLPMLTLIEANTVGRAGPRRNPIAYNVWSCESFRTSSLPSNNRENSPGMKKKELFCFVLVFWFKF